MSNHISVTKICIQFMFSKNYYVNYITCSKLQFTFQISPYTKYGCPMNYSIVLVHNPNNIFAMDCNYYIIMHVIKQIQITFTILHSENVWWQESWVHLVNHQRFAKLKPSKLAVTIKLLIDLTVNSTNFFAIIFIHPLLPNIITAKVSHYTVRPFTFAMISNA